MDLQFLLRPGCVLPAGVAVAAVGRRIEALKRRHATAAQPEGYVTWREVLDDAADPASPLHPCFEWDDTAAALQYRKDQAERLSRCYTITVVEVNLPTLHIPANIRVVQEGERRIVGAATAMSDEELRVQVLADCHRQLAGLEARLLRLEGLTPAIRQGVGRLMQALAAAIRPETPVKGQGQAGAAKPARKARRDPAAAPAPRRAAALAVAEPSAKAKANVLPARADR